MLTKTEAGSVSTSTNWAGNAFWIISAGAMKFNSQNLKQNSQPAFHLYQGMAGCILLSARARPRPNHPIAGPGPANTHMDNMP